jgi:hypothetical protein
MTLTLFALLVIFQIGLHASFALIMILCTIMQGLLNQYFFLDTGVFKVVLKGKILILFCNFVFHFKVILNT